MKQSILYLGTSVEKQLPSDGCYMPTKCKSCDEPVRIWTTTYAKAVKVAFAHGRVVRILCRGCFDNELTNAETPVLAAASY